MLFFKERQLFGEQDGPLVRDIQDRRSEYSPVVVLKGFCANVMLLPPPNVLKISLTLSRFLLKV